jgi:hypothetical protein
MGEQPAPQDDYDNDELEKIIKEQQKRPKKA